MKNNIFAIIPNIQPDDAEEYYIQFINQYSALLNNIKPSLQGIIKSGTVPLELSNQIIEYFICDSESNNSHAVLKSRAIEYTEMFRLTASEQQDSFDFNTHNTFRYVLAKVLASNYDKVTWSDAIDKYATITNLAFNRSLIEINPHMTRVFKIFIQNCISSTAFDNILRYDKYIYLKSSDVVEYLINQYNKQCNTPNAAPNEEERIYSWTCFYTFLSIDSLPALEQCLLQKFHDKFNLLKILNTRNLASMNNEDLATHFEVLAGISILHKDGELVLNWTNSNCFEHWINAHLTKDLQDGSIVTHYINQRIRSCEKSRYNINILDELDVIMMKHKIKNVRYLKFSLDFYYEIGDATLFYKIIREPNQDSLRYLIKNNFLYLMHNIVLPIYKGSRTNYKEKEIIDQLKLRFIEPRNWQSLALIINEYQERNAELLNVISCAGTVAILPDDDPIKKHAIKLINEFNRRKEVCDFIEKAIFLSFEEFSEQFISLCFEGMDPKPELRPEHKLLAIGRLRYKITQYSDGNNISLQAHMRKVLDTMNHMGDRERFISEFITKPGSNRINIAAAYNKFEAEYNSAFREAAQPNFPLRSGSDITKRQKFKH